MRNDLDHSIDPVVSLQQMVHVVRPGGYVVLKHYPDEAEGAAYTGLHSWNLNERKGRFIIWQRPGPEIDVGQALGETAEVKAWRDTQWIYAAIKRTR
jgi:hypothetical protein